MDNPFTVVDSYLIGAMEFLSFEVEIGHVGGDVMSRTGVWIPIEVRVMGRGNKHAGAKWSLWRKTHCSGCSNQM